MKTNKDFDFDTVYLKQCSLESSTPSNHIRTMARSKFLEIEAEKLQKCDWNALLSTINVNKDMEKVSIRNIRTIENFYKTRGDLQTNRSPKKHQPSINDPIIIRKLVRSLTGLISYNKSLVVLHLEGLSLSKGHIICILKFIRSSEVNLKSLSFAYSNIEDEGAKTVFEGIQDSISVLNLSGCGLTNDSVSLLCGVIKSHAVRRHDEAWKHTLRYQLPNFDTMNCLRRVTLNDNPSINDDGVNEIAVTLENDVWVKAVDLQRIGITAHGGQAVLDMLRQNTSLFVFDIRDNQIDSTIVNGIHEQLRINCGSGQSSFGWLSISPFSKSENLRINPKTDDHSKVSTVNEVNKLREEINGLKLQLKKFNHENKELVEQLSSLFKENKRLTKELSKHALLENNEFLSYIEETFKQFNVFFSNLNEDSTPKMESDSVFDAFMQKISTRSELIMKEFSSPNVSGEEGEVSRLEDGLDESVGTVVPGSEEEYSNDFIDD